MRRARLRKAAQSPKVSAMSGIAQPPVVPAETTPLRVLVVEDDPAALSATVELLQLLGHWATGVKSAEVAKDRFIDGAFEAFAGRTTAQ